MTDLKNAVGEKSAVYREKVSAESIGAFSRAAGSSSAFPPTFWTRFRKGEFELFSRLGFPLSRVLHGEQNYQVRATIAPGSEVEYATVFKSHVEKKTSGGSLNFFVFETEIRSEGKDLATARTTIIVRGELK